MDAIANTIARWVSTTHFVGFCRADAKKKENCIMISPKMSLESRDFEIR